MKENGEEREEGEFKELLKYTFPGYLGGLALGFGLDQLGFQQSALGQAVVRTVSGEGESIFEGIFAVKQRLSGAVGSMAEAYGWGKLIGMSVPWVVDAGSRLAGVDVNGIGGFYIPYFYALSDQIGANVSGLAYTYRKEKSFGKAIKEYVKDPVMLTSGAVILAAPLGLLGARMLGFSPDTQVATALETIAANACWLPPVVGWLNERRKRGKE